MNYKIKIITGYRKDQAYSIDAEETHKAYYLFLNPDKRGVFNNGLAITGQDIRAIEPDYVGTMGWNPGYDLTAEDWNEIRSKGVDTKLRDILSLGRSSATLEMISKPLSEVKMLQSQDLSRMLTG